jgi:hypothetical protein
MSRLLVTKIRLSIGDHRHWLFEPKLRCQHHARGGREGQWLCSESVSFAADGRAARNSTINAEIAENS